MSICLFLCVCICAIFSAWIITTLVVVMSKQSCKRLTRQHMHRSNTDTPVPPSCQFTRVLCALRYKPLGDTHTHTHHIVTSAVLNVMRQFFIDFRSYGHCMLTGHPKILNASIAVQDWISNTQLDLLLSFCFVQTSTVLLDCAKVSARG